MLKNKRKFIVVVWLYLSFTIAGLLGYSTSFGAERVHAVFFQPSKTTRIYSPLQLETEFKLMKEIGIKTVVIQWVASTEQAYYPAKSIPIYRPDLVKEILDKASMSQMDVFFGLPMPVDWFSAEKTTAYLMLLKTKAYIAAVELIDLYGDNPVFKGWYLPYEFPVSELNNNSLRRFIIDLTNDLKKLTPGKEVMIAPYLDKKSVWSTQKSTVWESFLSDNPIDIIALQDGVGASELQPELVSHYYKFLREICRKTGHTLWAVVEVFNKDFTSAMPQRVIKQLKMEGPVVDSIIIFDFSHYLNPDRNERSAMLYKELKDYLKKNK